MPYRELEVLLTKLKAEPARAQWHQEAFYGFKTLLESDPVSFENFLNSFQPGVYEILRILFEQSFVKHQYLAPLVARQLMLKYAFEEEPGLLEVGHDLAAELAGDDLFLALLERTYNVDRRLETVLITLRKFLLSQYQDRKHWSPDMARLAITTALQCFNNEYVFDEKEDERAVLDALSDDLVLFLDAKDANICEEAIFLLGMYRPLCKHVIAEKIVSMPLDSFSLAAQRAITRMVHEPFLEKQIQENIPSFGEINDEASVAVRSHYEANPFPRWFDLTGPFESVDDRLRRVQPGFGMSSAPVKGRRSILVAGCGTGQQPLTIAAGNPGADIVAVDLSLASLAYAKRMAERYQLENVTFLHGDILDLPALGKEFDHIESVGVLHCFEDPFAGWRVIEQILKPGGTFYVAVYSQLARLQVEWVRRQIQERRLGSSVTEMKQFRQEVLFGDQFAAVRKILLVRDFFNMSMFRDFLFHTHEYCYLLPEIEGIISELNFNFLGFEPGHVLFEKYRSLFPDDRRMNQLDNWMDFEVHYTGTLKMFCCWLQKPEG